jgi:16S rRNA (uracil1498-N3)-methyltransferase
VRRRFFVDQFASGTALLRGEGAEHLGRVLRAQPGQLYELSDSRTVWLARVASSGRDEVRFDLVEQVPVQPDGLYVTLLLSIVKFDRFEWALEKATELGVAGIVPVAAERSERGLVAAAEKRGARWRKILREAGQQARRLAAPHLQPTTSAEAAFAAAGDGARLLLSEQAEAPGLRKALGGWPPGVARAALAIGPEGGWTDREVTAARSAGFAEVSLGRNILRTETAVVASLAAVNYALAQDS